MSSDIGDFDGFFTSTYSRTMAKALLMDGHRQDDEDAVAEAYAIVAARWDKVSRYDAPEAYLYVTMQRLVWRAVRRRKQRAEEPVPDHIDLPAPAASGVADVLDALAELSPMQRAVVVLCCVEGYEQKTVAKMLGIARGTVATHLSSARHSLDRLLGRVPARDEFVRAALPQLSVAETALDDAYLLDHVARERIRAKIAATTPTEPTRRLWGRR